MIWNERGIPGQLFDLDMSTVISFLTMSDKMGKDFVTEVVDTIDLKASDEHKSRLVWSILKRNGYDDYEMEC